MSKPYEPPVITKLQGGLMNKFGRSTAAAHEGPPRDRRRDASTTSWRAHGSPLFVFSERRIREKYREAYNAFSHRYPNVLFAWSYKTNYLAAICAIMHQEGAIAEVVSEMEYAKARALGIPGDQIIFNGPVKPLADPGDGHPRRQHDQRRPPRRDRRPRGGGRQARPQGPGRPAR